jgi:RHS repeat-associated protein
VGVDTSIASKVPVTQYEYLGAARLVGTDLLQPKARWNHFEGAVSGTPYPDLDRFNRVEDSRWTSYKGTGGGTRDFYDVDIAYDPASNILSVTDNVHKNSSGNRNFDALYTLDQLNRLVRAEEGTLSGGSISNRSRDERWQDASGNLALSQTGNWLRRRLDLNGDGAFTGTGELDDTGAFSLANELKTRDTDSNGTANYTLAYDKSGNQTDDGKDYTYVYDGFGRLRQVKNRSDSSLVAEYRYNGLSFRIGWHYDADADKDVDSSDPWYYFCYDDIWRVVATFRADDADPKEVFVYHNAGFGGYGGSSYIDSVILRDRDADTKWTDPADDKREERRYYCQNWRADVSAILTDAGSMVEWVKYSSYGVPFALPAGDTDSDGDWDATDSGRISTSSSYDVRQDANLDGTIGAADITHANSITGGYQTLGRGILSSSGTANRKGYAGYEYDPTLEGAGKWLYHVRHRVYDADVGRWLRRDPLGYVDGMSLYEYVEGLAVIATDPYGLAAAIGSSCAGSCMPSATAAGFPEMSCEALEAEMMAGDTITEAIKSCMKMPTFCLRYQCLEQIYDSFNQLCGGCLEEYVRHLRTLINLWCLRGDPSKVTKSFCDAQYAIMKPVCDKCGSCRVPGNRQPTESECRQAKKTASCLGVCIGWYQWFDAVCAKGPGGKPDPKRHATKIKGMQGALQRCGKVLARCGRIGSE